MGIACAPQIWMDYITLILSELKDKKKYIAMLCCSTVVVKFKSLY